MVDALYAYAPLTKYGIIFGKTVKHSNRLRESLFVIVSVFVSVRDGISGSKTAHCVKLRL